MIDLHLHSTCSDGSEPPSRVAELAAEAGCRAMALTDHDTLAGIPEARRRGEELGIEVIGGVELSCHTSTRTVHILGYFLDSSDSQLLTRLETQRTLRAERNIRLVNRLQELGCDITLEDVSAFATGQSTGRPHVAAALVAKGYATSIDDAFSRYLADTATAYVERKELSAREGIRWIREAGGVAVWAHPLTPERFASTDIRPTVEELIDCGLAGIEAKYSRYDPDSRRNLSRLAGRLGIVATGGSDFHGSFKRGLVVGRGEGNLEVPDSALEELRQLRPHLS